MVDESKEPHPPKTNITPLKEIIQNQDPVQQQQRVSFKPCCQFMMTAIQAGCIFPMKMSASEPIILTIVNQMTKYALPLAHCPFCPTQYAPYPDIDELKKAAAKQPKIVLPGGQMPPPGQLPQNPFKK